MEALANLGIEVSTLLTQIGTFFILFGLLYLVAYKPIMRMLDERSNKVKESMEHTEYIKEQAAHAEEEAKKQIETASKEGQEVIARAVRTGEEVRQQAQQEARKEAEVLIEALKRLRVKGRKIYLSRQPRTLARLYNMELKVSNPDGHILPGMFARVELVKAIFEGGLAIPLYAVITEGEERYVYVERGGRAQRRNIQLGILVGWEVQVTSGLKPQEHVIIVGHRFLDEGQHVKVIKNVSNSREILNP